MGWVGIDLKPGVNVELTSTALKTGYASTWLGRFKAGFFQKIGGWSKFTNLAISGVPKFKHAWQALSGTNYLAVGSTTSLNVLTPSTQVTVTPQTFSSSCALNFTTTIGSTTVTIADANLSTITPYCTVNFMTPVSVDGIILSGAYAIQATLSATTYTITAATSGVAGVSGGGSVPAFTTTSGSSSVTVTLSAHGLTAGSSVVFPLATTIGGLTIQGNYSVVSITDANNFVISASSAASSGAGPTSMNGGQASFVYYVALGPTKPGGVYGGGNYGDGLYGLGTQLIGQAGTPITATDWTLANWGELLISSPEGGGIYYWGPSSGLLNAQMIATAPQNNAGIFVSTSQQMIIAYGSTSQQSVGYYQDPLVVKWCNVQDFTDWTPKVTNQAGSYRIPTGSKIAGGAATPFGSNLIWTDLDVWSMNYVGSQFVFGFQKIGSNCGLAAKHAHTQLAGNVFWMGKNNFFALTGGNVDILPCPVWDTVFQDLDTANVSKCFAGSNTLNSEVWFFYPSLADGAGYCTRYVKVNTVEGVWDLGPMQRNTWIDQNVFGPPMAVTNGGLIYSHETGFDADTAPITSGFTTGYFYIDQGEDMVFIDQIIPDFKFGTYAGSASATIQITVNAISEMGQTPISYGPYTVTASTPYIPCRIRARQISFTIQSSDPGSFWRLGHIRARYTPDGRR